MVCRPPWTPIRESPCGYDGVVQRLLVTLLIVAIGVLVAPWWLRDAPHTQGADFTPSEPAANDNLAGQPGLKGRAPREYAPTSPEVPAEERPAAGFGVWALVEDAITGDPIADAHVTVRLPDGTLSDAATAGNGLARIEGLRAMPVQVTAAAAGYAPDAPERFDRAFRTTARVYVRLWPVRKRPIRVVELETGAPVAGAQLVLYHTLLFRVNRSPFQLEAPIDAGRTDAGGHATLTVRTHEDAMRGRVLAAHAPGRRSTWWPLPGPRQGGPAGDVFRLPPGGALVGTVRDGAGRGLGGVSISAYPGSDLRIDALDGTAAYPLGPHNSFGWSQDAQEPGRESWQVALTTTTDASGRFEIQGLGLGLPYTVHAKKSGFTPATSYAASADARTGIYRWHPVLRKAGRLVVRVVDPSGDPMAHVYGSASMRSPGYLNAGYGTTDARGRLVFENLDTGSYDVGLQPKAKAGTPKDEHGHAPYDHAKGWNLAVTQGKTTEVTLVLPYGAYGEPRSDRPDWLRWIPIQGVVVDGDGTPLEGVVVRDRTGAPLAVTAADGTFSGAVIAGYGVTLGINGPYASRTVYEPSEDGTPLRIVARPRRLVPLRVRLVLPEGAGPPDHVSFHLGADQHGGWGFTKPLPAGDHDLAWTPSDARELLFDEEVQPGTWTVSVTADGFLPLRGKVIVDPEHDVASATWTLQIGAVARGRVVDEGGEGIAGARVTVSSSTAGQGRTIQSTTTTDAAGRFTASGLAAGPWTYAVEAEGFLRFPRRQRLVFTRTDQPKQEFDPQRIVLRRAGRVRVIVQTPDGLARPDTSVSLERQEQPGTEPGESSTAASNEHAYGKTTLDGTASFVVAPGTWRVELPSGLNGVPDLAAPRVVEVKPGETQTVTFRLRRR